MVISEVTSSTAAHYRIGLLPSDTRLARAEAEDLTLLKGERLRLY